jgi:hypothetical protein
METAMSADLQMLAAWLAPATEAGDRLASASALADRLEEEGHPEAARLVRGTTLPVVSRTLTVEEGRHNGAVVEFTVDLGAVLQHLIRRANKNKTPTSNFLGGKARLWPVKGGRKDDK